MHTTLATYDPDVVRWGLHELDGGGGLSVAGTNNPSNTYAYPIQTPEPHWIKFPDVQNSIVNDEAIAHAFQEELSKLPDTAESSLDSSKDVVLNQSWQDFNSTHGGTRNSLGPSRESEEYYGQPGDYRQYRVNANYQSSSVDDRDTMGPPKIRSGSSSSSTARNSPPDYDSYQYGDDDEENLKLALALSTSEEQHQLDNEVAKRLTKLDSIRHVPRVNADELPTFDDASLDHARLMERLVLYGLNERQIQGDGNCQFRALSDQLYRTPEHHKFVRKSIVTQLKAHPDVYEGYVTMPYSEYLKKMAKSGEWGDHVTLQAAADSYGVKIWLITSFKDTSFIEILPDRILSNRVIYLSFWAEVHYNSIYPEGANASAGILLAAPKKKHWLLAW
ncbi:unnamed protein product [Calypogeia fissa]